MIVKNILSSYSISLSLFVTGSACFKHGSLKSVMYLFFNTVYSAMSSPSQNDALPSGYMKLHYDFDWANYTSAQYFSGSIWSIILSWYDFP